MRPPIFPPSIIRLSGRPRPGPDDIVPNVAVRPRGMRRPHTDGTIAAVRRLFEQTTLTYEQISARCGVALGSISRWSQAGEWKRPLFAPFAMDTVKTPRAIGNLRHRMLATRLTKLADRYVRELEETPGVDLEKLGQALELWKMARLATMRRTPRRAEAAFWNEPMRPISELCAAGVILSRAPRDALKDFLENREMPRAEDRPPRSRGRGNKRYFTRAQRHAWMLERE
jgi:hypothetical protein